MGSQRQDQHTLQDTRINVVLRMLAQKKLYAHFTAEKNTAAKLDRKILKIPS